MNLLIVDDSANVRLMIREVLVETDCEIYECSDGFSAIEHYKKNRPDVVLMDIKMKNLNGLIATKRILELDSKAKIIIVSNYDDDFMRAETKRVGAIKYFTKEEIYEIPEYIKTITRN